MEEHLAIMMSDVSSYTALTKIYGSSSAAPTNVFATVLKIVKHTSTEPKFLQIHGGLHYGKVLRRNNRFFGSTINQVSRIAAKANPGTLWCS